GGESAGIGGGGSKNGGAGRGGPGAQGGWGGGGGAPGGGCAGRGSRGYCRSRWRGCRRCRRAVSGSARTGSSRRDSRSREPRRRPATATDRAMATWMFSDKRIRSTRVTRIFQDSLSSKFALGGRRAVAAVRHGVNTQQLYAKATLHALRRL